MSNVLYEDIQNIVNSDLPWHKLANSTTLVTGATGLIGSNLVRTLRAVSEVYSLNLNLIEYTRKSYGDIRLPLHMDQAVDYIFHCAAITSSADMVAKPIEVILTSVVGTNNILDFARQKKCKGVVYLSSMEMYGTMEKKEVLESDLGYLDLSNPRSSYPESKRMCENLCISYYTQYGIPVKIARLALTLGAGTANNPADNRVAKQFARSAMKKESITLHTEGNSIVNCVYTADAVLALFTILLKGENGQAYNISADSVTVRKMAELVAGEYGIKVIVDIPENIAAYGYAPAVGYTMNSDKMRGLGWQPQYMLLDMYKHMIADWREEEVE